MVPTPETPQIPRITEFRYLRNFRSYGCVTVLGGSSSILDVDTLATPVPCRRAAVAARTVPRPAPTESRRSRYFLFVLPIQFELDQEDRFAWTMWTTHLGQTRSSAGCSSTGGTLAGGSRTIGPHCNLSQRTRCRADRTNGRGLGTLRRCAELSILARSAAFRYQDSVST